MSDVLEKICADTRSYIAMQKARIPEAALREEAAAQTLPRGFAAHLQAAVDLGKFALIAEVKKASPSKGVIREDFNPASIARAYEEGGATCLSVLTNGPYFKGDIRDLKSVRAVSSLPIIRKDFIIDAYQIAESRAIGADCILLIMSALSDSEAEYLYVQASEMGMDVLVEVHNRNELERASLLNPVLLGINNRNLKTLEIDLRTSEELVGIAPEATLLVSESGLYTHDDLLRMARIGVNCFLVGESLMRQRDVATAVRKLLEGPGSERSSA